MKRSSFLRTLMAVPALAVTPKSLHGAPAPVRSRLKISLNAYSFNTPLRDGSMSLDDMLEFCAGTPIQAVDITGYYFPGYPAVPKDEYIYHIKRKAFRLGLDISGTGVRTDFTNPDKQKRLADVQLVKDWIECAAKLGAPVIRIFSGTLETNNWKEVAAYMMEDVKACIAHGQKHGVMVGIQNHNDFIKTADHVHQISKMVDSEWFGIILDTGSYRTGDPYQQIADTARYAINWQLKENVFINGVEQPADLNKIINAVKASGYQGYLPIETLGAGDPRVKVPVFVEKVRKALG
ncbi:sugar phosphate isomerase/epimerase family protein [Chitinophaga niabensis]|uniref:Sugar phosphate isomerase/epimerase n=1 Tax=Chitinophaga niabensis TaxID=536979 RepID=A0A1N6D3F9_9BACT|nr:sugar phosphate isomerase/epimerase family protein [Chitinophaga niabensis]SIN65338.1 Sugar phosphate isomerase/epimerase [Chitinophaga niabensis]